MLCNSMTKYLNGHRTHRWAGDSYPPGKTRRTFTSGIARQGSGLAPMDCFLVFARTEDPGYSDALQTIPMALRWRAIFDSHPKIRECIIPACLHTRARYCSQASARPAPAVFRILVGCMVSFLLGFLNQVKLCSLAGYLGCFETLISAPCPDGPILHACRGCEGGVWGGRGGGGVALALHKVKSVRCPWASKIRDIIADLDQPSFTS